jgi:hypothetical protein
VPLAAGASYGQARRSGSVFKPQQTSFVFMGVHSFFRHRIVATPAPGIAADDAIADEPECFENVVRMQGFQGVLGAGGFKAATAAEGAGDEMENGGEQQAVEMDQE